MAETLPALSTTRLKMRSGPAGTSATTSSDVALISVRRG
jgi:hypothetical protein